LNSFPLILHLELFKLFCLSFANNCFLGCKLKDLKFLNSLICPPQSDVSN